MCFGCVCVSFKYQECFVSSLCNQAESNLPWAAFRRSVHMTLHMHACGSRCEPCEVQSEFHATDAITDNLSSCQAMYRTRAVRTLTELCHGSRLGVTDGAFMSTSTCPSQPLGANNVLLSTSLEACALCIAYGMWKLVWWYAVMTTCSCIES